MPDRPSGPSPSDDEGAAREEGAVADSDRDSPGGRDGRGGRSEGSGRGGRGGRDERGEGDEGDEGGERGGTTVETGVPGPNQSGPETGPRVDRGRPPGGEPEREQRRPAPEPGTSAAAGSRRPSGWVGFVYDVATSVLAVALVGAFLFAVSGVWPPLVAVESGSMIPNMHEGDLVFVMEEHRFAGNGAVGDTGVVTAAGGAATDYRTFGGFGDVVVYAPDGNANRTPIIHRAMLWVEDGERWFDEADPEAIPSHVTSCTQLQYCPAPHAGFITKGDNNDEYDQANGLSAPVRPEWVVGTAEVRLPGLGWIRLGSR